MSAKIGIIRCSRGKVQALKSVMPRCSSVESIEIISTFSSIFLNSLWFTPSKAQRLVTCFPDLSEYVRKIRVQATDGVFMRIKVRVIVAHPIGLKNPTLY